MKELSKQYFQEAWGEGYYDHFRYGVGIEKVFETCILPFTGNKTALEIGSGGGVFTEFMVGKFSHLTAIDVITQPDKFKGYRDFKYFELPSKTYSCLNVHSDSIDFCLCFNVFCHLPNEAIREYIKSVHRVLKPGGDFVLMLSNFANAKKHVDNPDAYQLGDFLEMGHFYQDHRTIDLVVGEGWELELMLPDHRDIIVHLRKI